MRGTESVAPGAKLASAGDTELLGAANADDCMCQSCIGGSSGYNLAGDSGS